MTQNTPQVVDLSIDQTDVKKEALFSTSMALTTAGISAGLYGFFYIMKDQDLAWARDNATAKLHTIIAEGDEVAQNPSSEKALNYFGSPRNFSTEIDVQQNKINELNETNAMNELGGMGVAYSVMMGLAFGVGATIIKRGRDELKAAKKSLSGSA